MISFDDVTLLVLGVASIRQIIAQNFDLPIPNKFRWIIYDKKSNQQPVLCKRAYEVNKIKESDDIKKDPLNEWLGVVSRNIKNYPGGIRHGSEGRGIESNYFIDTLAASYSEKDLKAMVFVIHHLIRQSLDYTADFDFVICRKNGNTKLAENVFKYAGDDVIMVCYHDMRSKFPMHPHYSAEYLNSDYENLARLCEEAEKRDTSHRLNGIVIDCSVSTGKGLKKMINAFNEMVDKNHLNINPIEHAFVMHTNGKFDDSDINFELHRLVDMDETARRLIHEASAKGTETAYRPVKEYLKAQKLYNPLK